MFYAVRLRMWLFGSSKFQRTVHVGTAFASRFSVVYGWKLGFVHGEKPK